MRLLVDPTHDVVKAGGKALRFDEGDVDGFICWGHIPSIAALDLPIPEQFTRAKWIVDLEAYDDGLLVLHKERAFSSQASAKGWFRYAAWCISRMKPSHFEGLQPWKLS